MKKIGIFLGIALLLVGGLATPAKAITVTELLALISQLQAQLAAMLSELPEGCVSTSGFSPITGQSCGPTVPTITPTYGAATWACHDGTPGKAYQSPTVCRTSAEFRQNAEKSCAGRCSSFTGKCGVNSFSVSSQCNIPTNNLDPVITGVSGPISLAVGQQGTWTVNVTAPVNAQLEYNVNWGESQSGLAQSFSSPTTVISQSSTFTHSYHQSGTYTVAFYVTNNQQKGGGNPVKTTMTVVVGPQSASAVAYFYSKPTVTAEVVYSPTAKSGSAFKVKSAGLISSKGGDVYVPAQNAGLYPYGHSTENKRMSDRVIDRLNYPLKGAQLVNDNMGNQYYRLKEGVTYSYNIYISYDTSTMFSGAYVGALGPINYKRELNSNDWFSTDNQTYKSSPVSVVGEPVVGNIPVKISDATTYGNNHDAFVRLSIGGYPTNKQVHHWVLGYNCPAGVTLDTGKALLCDGQDSGKSGLTFYAYNIYDVTSDYLMITAGAQNKNSNSSSINFSLSARDADDREIGTGDYKTITLSGTGDSQTTAELRAQIAALRAQVAAVCPANQTVPAVPVNASISQLLAIISSLQVTILNCQLSTLSPVAPVITYNAGQPSHRIYLNFTNGAGQVTDFSLVPGFDRCYPLSTTFPTYCSAKNYNKGESCGAYLQGIAYDKGRCVVQISYADAGGKSTRWFEQRGNTDPVADNIVELSGAPTNNTSATSKSSLNQMADALQALQSLVGAMKF